MRRKIIGVLKLWLVWVVISKPAIRISEAVNTFLIIGGIWEIDSEKIELSLEDRLEKMRAEVAEDVLVK